MYNAGDNRLSPAGHEITGYEMVVEILKLIAPADDSGKHSGSVLTPAHNLLRRLRGHQHQSQQPYQPSNRTPADPTCIQSGPVSVQQN